MCYLSPQPKYKLYGRKSLLVGVLAKSQHQELPGKEGGGKERGREGLRLEEAQKDL